MSRRGSLPGAVLLCLLGASVVLTAAGRDWTSLDVPAGALSDARTVGLAGTTLVPGVRALGLVGLAGVVALAATRRTGRVVVGVVLLLAGAAVLAAVTVPDLTATTLRSAGRAGEVRTTAWPVVTAAGGLLLAAAGLLTALRGRSWPALGQRYDAPSAAAAPTHGPARATDDAVLSERSLWEALDRGEDPTAAPATLGSTVGHLAHREADRT